MKDRRTALDQLDYQLLFLLFVLLCISLLAVYSGSAALTEKYDFYDSFFFVRRHILAIAISVLVVVGIMSIDYEFFKNFSIPLYIFGLISLVLVKFSPLGIEVNGATRWLGVKDVFQFQPSELVKIIVLLTLAHVLYNTTKNSREKSFKNDLLIVGKILGIGLPPFALILIQPDLGTALVIGAVMFSMIIMSGVTYRMIGLLVSFVVSAIATLIWLHNNHFALFSKIIRSHQLERIYGWLDPEGTTSNEGYQLSQAMKGIGSGQLYGHGFGNGTQTHSGNIPELHTDFIFTVIGEEFGFVGATVLIILYFLLLYRMVIIAINSSNSYGTYLVAGCIGLFMFQIFQNIGMTIGLMPITGLALPFISYGGSALLTSMIAVGVVLNVNIRTKHYMFGEED